MITPKEKELTAVGIAVATGCKPCTDFHIRKVRDVGASDSEISEAITGALSVRRSAADIMEAYGLARLKGTKPVDAQQRVDATDRVKALVCIGAAFGVNCVTELKTHLEAAERLGISHEDVTTIVKLAAFIRGKAASHVEHLAETVAKPEVVYEQEVAACC